MTLRGAQRRVVRRSWWVAPLVALIAGSLVVLVHDVVVAAREGLFENTWLGVAGAISLLVGTVTLLVTRNQIAKNHHPHLRIIRSESDTSVLGLRRVPERLWTVELGNAGNGLVIVERVTYDVEVPGVGSATGVGFAEMLRLVKRTGRDDFVLSSWGEQTGLRPGEDRRLWEVPMSLARRLELVMHLQYESPMGDKFAFSFSLQPADGLGADDVDANR